MTTTTSTTTTSTATSTTRATISSEFYNIVVKTSDKFYGGTDNAIYITLFGEKDGKGKSTGELRLNKSGRNDFERNQVDDFRVRATALGT